MHAQHVAVTGQAVDTAVFIRQHLHIGGAELFQNAELLQRVRHVADQVLADQQLRIGERGLEDARGRAALRHRNVVAQRVGVVVRHQRHVRILFCHRGLVAFKQGLLRFRRGVRGPVAQGDRTGQIRVDHFFRPGSHRHSAENAQSQQQRYHPEYPVHLFRLLILMGHIYAVGLTLNFVYIIASRQVGCQCPFQNFFQISVKKGQKRYQTLQKRLSGSLMKPVLLFVLLL